MTYGKSRKEVVWLGLFTALFLFLACLLCLCCWGMYSRSFARFFIYATHVFIFGAPLLCICGGCVLEAEKQRKRGFIINLKGLNTFTKFKSSTVTIQKDWNGKTITIQRSEADALKELLDENDLLKRTFDSLEQMFKERVEQHNRDTRNHVHAIDDLRNRLGEALKDRNRYHELLVETVAQKEELNEQYHQLRLIRDKEQTETTALKRIAEKQKTKEKRLLERIKKSRKKRLVRKLAKSRKYLDTAMDVSYLFDHKLDSGEVADGIIELVIYLNHYKPTNDLREYAWSCRTVEKLLHDIRFGVVEDVFGREWENRMLSGLVGLNIITIAELESWCMHPYRH